MTNDPAAEGAVSGAWPSKSQGLAEAAGEFVSVRLPLFFAWFGCGVVLLLVLFVVWMSFVAGVPTQPDLTLQNYVDALDGYLFWRVIPNTAMVGLGTVAVVLFFSVPLAWLLHRTDVPYRELWITLIAVAVIVPGFLKAMGWVMLLSPKIGLINKFLMYVFGLSQAPLAIDNVWGVAFVQGLMLTPTMFFLLAGPMRSMDPALEEAAQVSGATVWRTMWWVSLPVLWPAILGGAIYTFMTAISIFEVAALLGGIGKTPVLATELFLNTNPIGDAAGIPRYGMSGVYGLMIAVPSFVALYYYLRVIERGHRYVVVTGKGYRPRDFELGRGRMMASAFVGLYLLLAVVLPLVVLVWASLLPHLAMPSVGVVIVGELALVSGHHERDRRGGRDFEYDRIDDRHADCGAVFQFHDFLGSGADAGQGEKSHRYDCHAAARDTGAGVCVCVDGGGDRGGEVGAVAAFVSNDRDHYFGQRGQSAVVRDADHQCGAVAGGAGVGGVGASVRGAALGDDVVGGGAVGALVVGVRRIVDGTIGVSRSLHAAHARRT